MAAKVLVPPIAMEPPARELGTRQGLRPAIFSPRKRVSQDFLDSSRGCVQGFLPGFLTSSLIPCSLVDALEAR